MFEEIKKNFGFGCMRLPMKGGRVDHKQCCQMVDYFLEQGFNYFDTAHGYLLGMSEKALKKCLVDRHPRDSFVLANKLTENYFKKEQDIKPFFEKQLKICGVDYFDFYLLHAQNSENYRKYKKCNAYEQVFELKKAGKIKHVGLSFHDTADVLDMILTEYPNVEFVQIQLNYIDYNSPAVQGKECYEVCRKHNKPVIVMEPVKGGTLVNLPDEAKSILNNLNGGSPATYAIRYTASFDGVFMTLSGMSNMEQMKDNISAMKDFKPLNEEETNAINAVCDVLNKANLIPCTACRYCIEGCPKNILIPDIFSLMNIKNLGKDWNPGFYYDSVCTRNHGKAKDCIGCGKCEHICPQHLHIRDLLKKVSKEFD